MTSSEEDEKEVESRERSRSSPIAIAQLDMDKIRARTESDKYDAGQDEEKGGGGVEYVSTGRQSPSTVSTSSLTSIDDVMGSIRTPRSSGMGRGISRRMDLRTPNYRSTQDDEGRWSAAREYNYRALGRDNLNMPAYMLTVKQWSYVVAWVGFLIAGFAYTRLLCIWGLPGNCDPLTNMEGVMEDVQQIFVLGILLGAIAGVFSPNRFRYIFSRKCWYFFMAFFVAIPVYSALLTALGINVRGGDALVGNQQSNNAAAFVLFSFVSTLVVGYHLVHAWSRFGRNDAIAYTLSRFSIFLFYMITCTPGMVTSSVYEFHIHRYLISYALATWCVYDHWPSVVLFGIMTGLFVQGLAAYDYTPLLSRKANCHSLNYQNGHYIRTSFLGITSNDGESEFSGFFCLTNEDGSADLHTPAGLLLVGHISGSTDACDPGYFPSTGCSSMPYP